MTRLNVTSPDEEHSLLPLSEQSLVQKPPASIETLAGNDSKDWLHDAGYGLDPGIDLLQEWNISDLDFDAILQSFGQSQQSGHDIPMIDDNMTGPSRDLLHTPVGAPNLISGVVEAFSLSKSSTQDYCIDDVLYGLGATIPNELQMF